MQGGVRKEFQPKRKRVAVTFILSVPDTVSRSNLFLTFNTRNIPIWKLFVFRGGNLFFFLHLLANAGNLSYVLTGELVGKCA